MNIRRTPQTGLLGFTLLEMIVAIAIIVALGGLAVPLVKKAIEDAKYANFVSYLDRLKRASNRYFLDTGALPVENMAGRNYLFSDPGTVVGWRGPYLDHPLKNYEAPYGNSVYVQNQCTGEPTNNNGFNIAGVVYTQGCQLVLKNVDPTTAANLDLLLDKGDGNKFGICEYGALGAMGVGNTQDVFIFLFKAP